MKPPTTTKPTDGKDNGKGEGVGGDEYAQHQPIPDLVECPLAHSSSSEGEEEEEELEDLIRPTTASAAAATASSESPQQLRCETCQQVQECDVAAAAFARQQQQQNLQPTTTATTTLSSPSPFLSSYRQHVEERSKLANGFGVAPKPLDVGQVRCLIDELVPLLRQLGCCGGGEASSEQQERQHDALETATALLELLTTRVPPGVDEAAEAKARFLADVASGKLSGVVPDGNGSLLSRRRAVQLLGTMQGGYNVLPLIELLYKEGRRSDDDDDDDDGVDAREGQKENIADLAAHELGRNTLYLYEDDFAKIVLLHESGIEAATKVLESWADADWFRCLPEVPQKLTVTVFKVAGETNTDALSPAQDAFSRPDIPLHAVSMLKNKPDSGGNGNGDTVKPDVDGSVGPLRQLALLKSKGYPVAFTGDVVGTGSSRKSATNSVLWHTGQDIPYVPNVRRGSVVLGGKIAPIFYSTIEDSGGLPIELDDVSGLRMGDIVDIYPYEGVVNDHATGKLVTSFQLKTDVLLDEVRAGGRIPLVVGRKRTIKAREVLGRDPSVGDVFHQLPAVELVPPGWTLAQKIVGKACGLKGVAPGQYCEPCVATVGSQDTTGPMTRDELQALACVKFSSNCLVLQTFCHTAAYPKLVDIKVQASLPEFFRARGGVALKPGDGIIHSWINRMALPDTVGTGGDSHTRFPIGISFPAGSGLVAFAAATGSMPLDMPESVLVKFTGTMQPGITLRDLVQAIPYAAIQQGVLTTAKKGKKNVFNGCIIEIEGLSHLKCEQAFELSCATAERSAAACTVKLDREPIVEYIESNATLLKWLLSNGYGDATALKARIARMEAWLADPELLEADPEAEYKAVVEVDMDSIKEPVLACPNDPDATALLSEVAGTPVDEVFIGSCMTNIGHFRAVASLLTQTGNVPVSSKLWMCPPTKMDKAQLRKEGLYSTYCVAGARMEIPGCSLCMGNQARVTTGSTVVSTSTRNFPDRLGKDTNVYLASAELAIITAIKGRIPTFSEYMDCMKTIEANETEIYRYLQFDQMEDYAAASEPRKI